MRKALEVNMMCFFRSQTRIFNSKVELSFFEYTHRKTRDTDNNKKELHRSKEKRKKDIFDYIKQMIFCLIIYLLIAPPESKEFFAVKIFPRTFMLLLLLLLFPPTAAEDIKADGGTGFIIFK